MPHASSSLVSLRLWKVQIMMKKLSKKARVLTGGLLTYRSDATGWVRVGDAVMGCFGMAR